MDSSSVLAPEELLQIMVISVLSAEVKTRRAQYDHYWFLVTPE